MEKFCPNGGKRCYANEKEAKHVRNNRERHGSGKGMRVYKCPACHLWHLTKQYVR